MEKAKLQEKPVIETIINTAAIALTAYAVMEITKGNLLGFISLGVGVGLELLKYWGRKYSLW